MNMCAVFLLVACSSNFQIGASDHPKLSLLILKTSTSVKEELRSDFSPKYSPNGKLIAFARDTEAGSSIWLMNSDGTKQKRLTDGKTNDYAPDWSPDGKQIVFVSNPHLNKQIYVMNADGSHRIRLTKERTEDIDPVWSPNGNFIAFASNRDGCYQIYIMNRDGSKPKRLTDSAAANFSPNWSPDSRKIVYTRNTTNLTKDFPVSAIFVMNWDGTNVKALSTLDEDFNSDDHCPVWSPDGKRIVFATERVGKPGIWVMNANGSNQKKLSLDTYIPSGLDWSPSGKEIVFSSTTRFDKQYLNLISLITVINVDGSSRLNLTSQ